MTDLKNKFELNRVFDFFSLSSNTILHHQAHIQKNRQKQQVVPGSGSTRQGVLEL